MALDLSGLVDAVTGETTAIDSLGVFIQNLKDQLNAALANVTDVAAAQAAVNGVMDTVLANKQKIVDAMGTNVTPVVTP